MDGSPLRRSFNSLDTFVDALSVSGTSWHTMSVAPSWQQWEPSSSDWTQGGWTLAIQDFGHTMQGETGDFVRHLECTFQVTYGRDGTLPQTRDALLYSQLHARRPESQDYGSPSHVGSCRLQSPVPCCKEGGMPTCCTENQAVVPLNCATKPTGTT